MNIQPIERIKIEDPAQCAKRLADNRPVVFEGAVSQWDATGKWTPEFFASHFAHHPLHLYDFTKRDAIECYFPDFLTYLRTEARLGPLSQTTQPLYLAWDARLIADNATLKNDFDFQPYFGNRRGFIHTGFWMGSKGSHTPLHTDIDSYNLHAVLYGRKYFLLFPPEDAPHLYPSDVYEWSTVFSSVDFRAPDFERFPDVIHATGYECEVQPGDLLFIPIGWWHTVHCMEPTTSLNGWLFDKRLIWSSKLYADLGRRLMHNLGLYARGRCTCHGHGDLSKHHQW